MEKFQQEFIDRWHQIVFNKDLKGLEEIISDKIIFYSPVVFKPKNTKEEALFVLTNVIEVFQDFKYHREFFNGKNLSLEFSANVAGKSLKGIDLIEIDDNGKIINMEVLIRPLSGIIALGEDMNRRFSNAGRETGPLIK